MHEMLIRNRVRPQVVYVSVVLHLDVGDICEKRGSVCDLPHFASNAHACHCLLIMIWLKI